MKLIYAWIEKYRNIEQCGFSLSNDFHVDITHEGEDEKNHIPIKSVKINENKKSINIYGDNINSITAIVGKNSVGKSNFLSVIGDLLTSQENSSFILIYYDESKCKLILECNKIAIRDKTSHLNISINDILLFSFDNNIVKQFYPSEEIHDIEYIAIYRKMDIDKQPVPQPNANAMDSNIRRYGLSFDESGVLDQYKYLKDSNNVENYKNNDILLHVGVLGKAGRKYISDVKLLPLFIKNEKNYYNRDCDNEREVYKIAFMLRFWEKVVNGFRFNLDPLTVKERKFLSELFNKCKDDINEIQKNYDKIKEKIIEMKRILMDKNHENTVDMNTCYSIFVRLLEQIALNVDAKYFMNSYEFSISISSIAKNKQLSELILNFLETADSEDVCTEFSGTLEIGYSNLSDGMKERLKLFSTIYKCLKQNKVENYKNVVLILDEPDAHMHPEWSRRLLTDILAFLDKEFQSTKFQIIFTTHSPFMLSDIIQEDVIYLSKNNEGKVIIDVHDIGTFGMNVHTLLKHSFFMDSTIGEFAKNQINEVIKFLNKKNYCGSMNKEKAYYICDNLGEKFIRDKLINLYKKKYHDEIENMEEKIKDLEKKINSLEESKVASLDLNKESLISIQTGLKNSLDTINNLIRNVGGEND